MHRGMKKSLSYFSNIKPNILVIQNIRRSYQIFHISVQTVHHERESEQQDHVDRIQFWYNQWISRSNEFQVFSIVYEYFPVL